ARPKVAAQLGSPRTRSRGASKTSSINLTARATAATATIFLPHPTGPTPARPAAARSTGPSKVIPDKGQHLPESGAPQGRHRQHPPAGKGPADHPQSGPGLRQIHLVGANDVGSP